METWEFFRTANNIVSTFYDILEKGPHHNKGVEVVLYEFREHKTFHAEWSFSRINVQLFTMSNRIILILAQVFLFIVIF